MSGLDCSSDGCNLSVEVNCLFMLLEPILERVTFPAVDTNKRNDAIREDSAVFG